MPRVYVIKAQLPVTDRRRHKSIERKRVAAYCRVSTDSEDQLNSYRSQVQYYTDKISENPDWMMAGIYADEAITGTQVAKREVFLPWSSWLLVACRNVSVKHFQPLFLLKTLIHLVPCVYSIQFEPR